MQALSLIDRQLDSKPAETVTDNIEAAKQFKEKVEALRYELDAKVSSVSPACPDVAQRAFDTANILSTFVRENFSSLRVSASTWREPIRVTH